MARQRYRIVERIDVGGMAEVYRGYALSIGGMEKEVAIKRVLPQLTHNQKFVAMFLDEARLAMHLSHANIVQVFDVGRAEGTYFIVMEYVEGHNLRRILQRAAERNRHIPPAMAAYIAIEVCKGLAHAHERRDAKGELLKIVHRDVSPPNVLVSKAGEVKIVDFGLAKAATQAELTDPGVVKGKFSYLSPEAAEGRSVDHRADIFSLGSVLYEMIVGERLFAGRTDLETVELVRRAHVPSLRRLLPPEEAVPLDRILRKALARDPTKRYASARDFAEDLANFLFETHQKVTALDLANFVEDLFSGEGGAEWGPRIEEMLREEIVNLSSLGLVAAQGSRATQPIDVDELSERARKMGTLPLSVMWPDPATAASLARPALEARERAAAAQAVERRSRRTLVWGAAGIVLLVVVLGYIVVRVVMRL